MNRLIITILLFIFTITLFGQGRLRERKNQHRRSFSHHKKRSGVAAMWKYRPTPLSGYKHGGRSLYHRYVTSNKKYITKILTKQNLARTKARNKNTNSFHKRRY